MIPLSDDNPTRRTPYVTIGLILASVITFFAVQPEANSGDGVRFTFEYAAIPCELAGGAPLSLIELNETLNGDDQACDIPGDTTEARFPDKNVWLAVIVSMFLHGGLLHLGGNMLFLWIFGNNIEDHLGHIRYLLFYLAAGGAATAAHVAVQLDSSVPVIGASGAVAGVMGAYLVWFPSARVRTLVFLGFIVLFPKVPAALMLAVWFVSQFFIGPEDGVAWMAHVGGFVFGALIALPLRSMVTKRQAFRPAGAHRSPTEWWDDPHRR
ncbi:MAG: rhomboid family intramembrane serine protease [Actinomycetota bacterium]